MHKILDLISSKTFRNVFCFVTFTVLLTGIISSQNFFFQKVIENGISKTDVIANKDIKVIDTRKTEQHKKEVAQNVEPILTQAEDEFITNSLITSGENVFGCFRVHLRFSVYLSHWTGHCGQPPENQPAPVCQKEFQSCCCRFSSPDSSDKP